eukprot:gene11392-19877_t
MDPSTSCQTQMVLSKLAETNSLQKIFHIKRKVW